MEITLKWARLVGWLTWYRILASPVILFTALSNKPDLFKWLLVISFLTDAIDGPLSRYYKVASDRGALLDSIGDDLTVAVAVIGLWTWEKNFILANLPWAFLMLGLLFLEVSLALIKYGKMTSFHTYLSKTAAVLQGIFLCCFFLIGEPPKWLFYLCVMVTCTALIEEILLVLFLRYYECDVKGIYWKWPKMKRII